MEKVHPRVLNGFVEYLPQDQILFNRIIQTITAIYEKYGFLPIETPALEFSEILLAKEGGDTEKQIYRFSKNDSDLTMHYDLTVPLARYVAEHKSELVFPFRRYQTQKVWRAERPQKGRFREFYQSDIDIIGGNSILNDAEIVAIIYDVFHSLGIEDFQIRINNRKVLNGFLESIGIQENAAVILRTIDKLDKLGRDIVLKEFEKNGLSSDQIEKIFNFLALSQNADDGSTLQKLKETPAASNETFSEGVDELAAITKSLKDLGVPEKNHVIDLSIARGLDYYTGTVYETILTGYEGIGSVCSGGRYDNLLQHFSDSNMSGVGVSIGLTRLYYQLKEAGVFTKNKAAGTASVLIASMDSSIIPKSMELASFLRSAGINTQIYLEQDNIRKQLRYASKLGIPFTVIMGEDEIKQGKLTLKNMQTSQQELLSREDAVSAISQYINGFAKRIIEIKNSD